MTAGNPPTTVTQSRIVSDLRDLGLQSGDLIFMHSSLSSLGWVNGGADSVIDALLDSISPGGTAMVPTLTFGLFDPERSLTFDPLGTPGRVGRIPEVFRKRPEARRSRHPTHSVAAIGPLADELVQDHEFCETPCGRGSPYDKLREIGGEILLLGCTHEANTSLHAIEEFAGAPVAQMRFMSAEIVEPDGSITRVRIRVHGDSGRKNFDKIDDLLTEEGVQTAGKVADAETRLVDVEGLWRVVGGRLREDIFYLLADDAARDFRVYQGCRDYPRDYSVVPDFEMHETTDGESRAPGR